MPCVFTVKMSSDRNKWLWTKWRWLISSAYCKQVKCIFNHSRKITVITSHRPTEFEWAAICLSLQDTTLRNTRVSHPKSLLKEYMETTTEKLRLKEGLGSSYDETDVMIISTDGIIYPALPCLRSSSEYCTVHVIMLLKRLLSDCHCLGFARQLKWGSRV